MLADASSSRNTVASAAPPRALIPKFRLGMRCAETLPVALADGLTESFNAVEPWKDQTVHTSSRGWKEHVRVCLSFTAPELSWSLWGGNTSVALSTL